MIKRLFVGILPIVAALAVSHTASARDFTCTYKLVDRRANVIEFFEAVSYYSQRDACIEARTACRETEEYYYDARCRRVDNSGPGRGTRVENIICNHLSGGRKVCEVNGRVRDVILLEQHSRAECIEGYSYGRARYGVWVEDGCRGRFRVTYSSDRPYPPGGGNPPDIVIPIPIPGPGPYPEPWPNPGRTVETYLTCESDDFRYEECRVPGRILDVYIADQISSRRCVLGQNYDFYNNRIWVDEGCRATFRVKYQR